MKNECKFQVLSIMYVAKSDTSMSSQERSISRLKGKRQSLQTYEQTKSVKKPSSGRESQASSERSEHAQ